MRNGRAVKLHAGGSASSEAETRSTSMKSPEEPLKRREMMPRSGTGFKAEVKGLVLSLALFFMAVSYF